MLPHTSLITRSKRVIHKIILNLCYAPVDLLLANTGLGCKARTHLLRWFEFDIAKTALIAQHVQLSRDTHIGQHTFINANVLCDGIVHIGNYVQVGMNSLLLATSHLPELHPNTTRADAPQNPVTLEDYVWIAANVTLLPGVTIGQGAIIGAGSVVTHSIPPHTLAAGNPARHIRTLTQTTTK